MREEKHPWDITMKGRFMKNNSHFPEPAGLPSDASLPHRLFQFPSLFFFLCLLSALSSCARLGNYAKEHADKDAYKVIAAKQYAALGRADEFSIATMNDETTSRVLTESPRLNIANDTFTTPAYTLSLDDTMAIAIANNRDYKSRRESFYSQALSLIETRRNYQFLYTASANGSYTRTEQGNDTEYGTTVERFGARGFSAGVSKVLATGANITLDFSHSFVRFFTHDPRPSASNSLSFSIVQPLLRGAGSLVALESLRQAERSMIYSARDFRRYQQGFIINVAEGYYGLLSARDQLVNAQKNYQSTTDNLRYLQRLASAGRKSGIEVDQARQKVLEAESSLSSTQKAYGRQLDQFKIFLGIPLTLDIGPDPTELNRIAERGLLRPDMTLSQAIDIALKERLDLKNTHDAMEDSERAVKIALQNFLPNLNAGYNYSTSTGDDKDRVRLDFRDNTNAFSLDLGLPFDWTPRRNDYRRALINADQARRSLEQFREQLILEVRDNWRELEDSRTDYRIQVESVRLTERRVKSTSLFLQSGRATARDLLDAQDTFLSSRNALTNALVRHTIQRLRFWNSIERLTIDEKGMWREK